MSPETVLSKEYFIVQKPAKARQVIKLTAIFTPLINIFVIFMLNYLNLPQAALFAFFALTSFCASTIFTMYYLRWRIKVEHEGVYYRALFSERLLSFADIKRATMVNGAIKLYSAEGKSLLCIGLNDDNADLFMDYILEQQVEVC